MKLDEFIKEAVVEIMRGIDTSDKELRESNLGSIIEVNAPHHFFYSISNNELVIDPPSSILKA